MDYKSFWGVKKKSEEVVGFSGSCNCYCSHAGAEQISLCVYVSICIMSFHMFDVIDFLIYYFPTP